MKWKQEAEPTKLAILSWCETIEPHAVEQIQQLAMHPALCGHVALMPDCHLGKGMPIGGVIAAKNSVIPSAVGVDIGCGMRVVQTNIPAEKFADMRVRRELQLELKKRIPVGEGHAHKAPQVWDAFEKRIKQYGNTLGFPNQLDRKNLGTLGGGNHFIELQKSDDGFIYLMIHSGSRNLGQRVENYYANLASNMNAEMNVKLPNPQLAFLTLDTPQGQDYLRDMNFALNYAKENRRRMMSQFKEVVKSFEHEVEFLKEIDIHHNYAIEEEHFGEKLYIHRKGATSAQKDEIGIIPGSMGTASYIVRGLGNPLSYCSCSHGAGRLMSRTQANSTLTAEICDESLQGIVYERWQRAKSWRAGKHNAGNLDLSEAPQAYKNIDEVIASELDLIEVLVRLTPLVSLKG